MAPPGNLSRLGVIDSTTDGSWEQDNALFLKVFGEMVIEAFQRITIFRGLHMTKTIAYGKSAQFPVMWRAGAKRHVPGESVWDSNSNSINHGEQIIYIDDALIADVFVAEIDEMKNHYQTRQYYAGELARAVGREYDENVCRTILVAASSAPVVTGPVAGGVLKNVNAGVDGEILAGLISAGAQVFDESDVPEDQRSAVFRPAQYHLLAQTPRIMNRDWGGVGSVATANIPMHAGVGIMKSNSIPNDNTGAAGPGEHNPYWGDFTDTLGPMFHYSAVGTVALQDITSQMTSGDFNIQYQGMLMLAKYVLGHGVLRPESAIELSKAA